MAIRKIRLRRGLEANLPTLDVGEPGFTTDTKKMYIGSSTGNVLVNGQGGSAIKSTADNGRVIEEVFGNKTVSITAGTLATYESTSSKTTNFNYEIYVTRTPGSELDLIIQELYDLGKNNNFEISFDNVTFTPVWISSIQASEYWFYYQDSNGTVDQTQGNPIYIKVFGPTDPVVWWDKADLPSGPENFRGAIIDYHAYIVGEGTIIGSIHMVDDTGNSELSHRETLSGSENLEESTLWHMTNEGQIKFRQDNDQAKTAKIHWSAKVFYGEEYYD
jgi:hypothetical protein